MHVHGQIVAERSATNPLSPGNKASQNPEPATSYGADTDVILEAQEQARGEAEGMQEGQQDPQMVALWAAAIEQMNRAIEQLEQAKDSPEALQEALAAQQAAYQTLLRLQAHEYAVSRRNSRTPQGSQGSRSQQMRQQLEELELTQSENRYETQSQARAPQSEERREDLQVMSRLQELARRQQDLNERLQELQTVLQQAENEAEREKARRELKRLREEEERLMSDLDELQQRMSQPENQSRMAGQRQQLEQVRQEVQRAAESAAEGAVSQALAAGTRAERQMQELRDQMRQSNASEFAEDMRDLRSEARELSRRQEEIKQQVDAVNDPRQRTLGGSPLSQGLEEDLARQEQRLTNLVSRMTDLSQQAEEAEPLMSRALYDALRSFTQEDQGAVDQLREDLLARGMLTRSLYERMKEIGADESARALNLIPELLEEGYLGEAAQAEERARAGIEQLHTGVERAAERVLGDDAEALRLARAELESLMSQLEREIAQSETGETNDSMASPRSSAQSPTRPGEVAGESQQDNSGQSSTQSESAQTPSGGASNGQPQAARAGGDPSEGTRPNDSNRTAGRNGAGGDTSPMDLDRLLGGANTRAGGPITGDDFAPWSDRLRDVEQLVEEPALRSSVARARERARQFRQEYHRDQQKPDWAVVRLEVYGPLMEVARAITEELARRDPDRTLVPLDRDPVPGRYSELVRRYYEALGKDQ
jgi:hypothetical protein